MSIDFKNSLVSEIVPNVSVYDDISNPMIIISDQTHETLYTNPSYNESFFAAYSQFHSKFPELLKKYASTEISKTELLIDSPFAEVICKEIELTNGSTASLYILKRLAFIKDENSQIHYKVLLTAERELNFGCWRNNVIDDRIFWSDGMARIFGYEDALSIKEEKNLKNLLKYIHEEDLEKALTNFKERVGGSKDTGTTDIRIRKIDGTIRYVRFKTHFIDREGSKVISLKGTIKDITEDRRNELIKQQQLSDLNKSNDALTQFAYTASHDLQEPLRKIEAYGSRLRTSLAENLDEKSERYLDRMSGAVKRMSQLIDDILTLSRLSSINTEHEEVDLTNVLEGIVNDYEESIKQSNAVINYKLPKVMGIKSQLHQLFQNLISNAIKFKNEDKDPEININYTKAKKAEKEAVGLDTNSDYYIVTVKDNGLGFEDKFNDIVFVPFKRLHGRSEYPGTGIGLAICKKVIENHNGVIQVNSKENIGTTFSIYLPIK